MLNVEDSALLVIDIQIALARVIHDKDAVIENTRKMILGAKVLGLPILYTEQYPQGLGRTVPQLAELLDPDPITKLTFNCCGENTFVRELKELGREQLLVAGMETHVCVYQTVASLLEHGYGVHVLADAVGSRTVRNRDIALDKMRSLGAQLTSVEIALFELLKVAQGDAFKEILKIVK